MTEGDIVFVRNPPPWASQRDRQLVHATALSHAARVSHQRRKAQKALQHDRRGVLPLRTVLPPVASAAPVEAQSYELRDQSGPVSQQEQEQESSELIGPLTILRKGNSDPFQSLSVAVTPRVNQILSFFKDAYLPRTYISDYATYYTPVAVDKWWENGIATLYDNCSAQAFLLTHFILMATILPSKEFTAEILVLRSRCYNALRARIQKCPDGDQTILDSVMFLFAAGVFAGDLFQANLHGNVLRKCLSAKVRKEGSNAVDHLIRGLFYDVRLSLSQMTRPIFALDSWVSEIVGPIPRPIDELLEPFKSVMSDIDDAIDCEPLRKIFVQFRQLIWLWTPSKPIVNEDGTSVFQRVLGRININKSILVSYYLDLQTRLDETNDRSANSDKFIWYNQCSLALGLLLFFNPLGGDPVISGRPLLGIKKTVFSHLHTAISAVLKTSFADTDIKVDPDLIYKYQNANLWVLFLGAQVEQGDSKKYPDPYKAWFNVMLRSLAQQMGLFTWPMIRKILTLFIYSDIFGPHGSTWLPKSLGMS